MIERIITNRKGESFTVLLDDTDAMIYDAFTWYVSTKGYVVRGMAGKRKRWLHRDLLMAPANMLVDHKDGDPLNNCKDNLRLCTSSENARNRKRSIANKSGYVGVSLDRESGKWYSELTIHGREISLGYFPTPIEAAVARDKAALIHHGEFARLNLPELVLAS